MVMEGKSVIGSTASVREAYANQVAYCRANDATVTARVAEAIAALFDRQQPGAFVGKIRDWQGSPLGDAVPLRSAGGLHALHLSGAAPELAPIYADESADDAAIIAAVSTSTSNSCSPGSMARRRPMRRGARAASLPGCCGSRAKACRRDLNASRSDRVRESI